MVCMLSEDSTFGSATDCTACFKNVKPIESISEIDSTQLRFGEVDTWEGGRQSRNFSCRSLLLKFIPFTQQTSACPLGTGESQLHTNRVPLYVKFRLQP